MNDIADLSSCIKSAYELEESGEARKASKVLMSYIIYHSRLDVTKFSPNGFIDDPDFGQINELLKTIDINKLSLHSMIGLIRSSCSFKDHLPDWQPCLELIHDRIITLDRDPKRLLIGLMKFNK